MLAELGPVWGALFVTLVIALGVGLTLLGAVSILATRGSTPAQARARRSPKLGRARLRQV